MSTTTPADTNTTATNTTNSPAATDGDEREPTRRVVLERAMVLVLPDDQEVVENILIAIRRAVPVPDPEAVEAWVSCGVFEGTKRAAIESYAGKPGTPDAKVGVFRAPSVKAWKDAEEYELPPPVVERRLFDEVI